MGNPTVAGLSRPSKDWTRGKWGREWFFRKVLGGVYENTGSEFPSTPIPSSFLRLTLKTGHISHTGVADLLSTTKSSHMSTATRLLSAFMPRPSVLCMKGPFSFVTLSLGVRGSSIDLLIQDSSFQQSIHRPHKRSSLFQLALRYAMSCFA